MTMRLLGMIVWAVLGYAALSYNVEGWEGLFVIWLENREPSRRRRCWIGTVCTRRLSKVGDTKSFERGDIIVYILYTLCETGLVKAELCNGMNMLNMGVVKLICTFT
jgi:hypothetical protein